MVAALSIKILIHDSHSLKEKRSVLRSVKDRLRNKFNLAVAEVGFHDQWNYAEIGASTVGVDSRIVEETMQKAISFLENDHRFEIVEVTRII